MWKWVNRKRKRLLRVQKNWSPAFIGFMVSKDVACFFFLKWKIIVSTKYRVYYF